MKNNKPCQWSPEEWLEYYDEQTDEAVDESLSRLELFERVIAIIGFVALLGLILWRY